MSLINIQRKIERLEDLDDFWKINPEIGLLSPYADLKKADKKRGKTDSSRMMWAIVIIYEINPENSTFVRFSTNERIENMKKHLLPKGAWNDELFQECYKCYPNDCLSEVEKSLKYEIDSMLERAELIRNTPYTLDTIELKVNNRGGEKIVTVDGTAKQLDNLRKATPALLKMYSELQAQYKKQEAEKQVGKGGQHIPDSMREGYW